MEIGNPLSAMGCLAMCFACVLAVESALAAEATSVTAATGASAAAIEPQVTIHVALGGDDGASGKAEAPLKTLGNAVQRAVVESEQGKAVRILIDGGVYRESVSIPRHKSGKPGVIVIEGQAKSDVVVSGSDLWTTGWDQFHIGNEEWKWFSDDKRFENARVYRHDWPYEWKDVENPWGGAEILLDPVAKRTEMVFMNGVLLRPVMAFGDMKEGTFHINADAKKLYVWPPAGIEPQTALTEVAVRTEALDTGGRDNLVVRGLNFRQARCGMQANGVIINGSRNVLVENCRFEWNSWGGLGCSNAKDVTVRNCVFTHNGVSGTGAYQSSNLLFEECEDSYNNWRGRMGGFVNWANGSKFLSTRTVTIRRHKAFKNETYGLWIDYDNKDVLIEESNLQDNLLAGVFLEASQGPIIVRDCVVSGNREGIMDGRSDNVSLLNNSIYNNRDAQILFSGNPQGRDIIEFDTKNKLFAQTLNWCMRGNRVEADSGRSCLVQVAGHITETEWQKVSQGMTAQGNSYSAPTEAAFRMRDRSITFAEWSKQFSIDRDSAFERKAK